MKINWKVRFKNKVWLLTFVGAIVAFVYTMFNMLGIAPKVDQEVVMNLVGTLLTFLALIGVVVDPTTKGTNDSDLAMTYERYDVTELDSMGHGMDESEVQ